MALKLNFEILSKERLRKRAEKVGGLNLTTFESNALDLARQKERVTFWCKLDQVTYLYRRAFIYI